MYVLIVPVVPVKYWRHPLGARFLLLHSICVTLMVKADVPAVLAAPKFAVSILQEFVSHAGMYMCSPANKI